MSFFRGLQQKASAIFGGRKAVQNVPEDIFEWPIITEEDEAAVLEVLRRRAMSGTDVTRKFEEEFTAWIRVEHALGFSSGTAALHGAMYGCGIGVGDEIICPSNTFWASALPVFSLGGTVVFADIDSDTFCLDPQAVRQAITPRTRAVLAVNLFGHPAPLEELMSIAREHNLMLVEDNAQGPLAIENGHYAGTIGHIGVFSLNYHKHIHTGEGGMCVTNDGELAQRLQLIRNHAENIVEPLRIKDITNLVGFNYRMTELSAAVGIEQLKKMDAHVGKREHLARQLTEGIKGLEGLTAPRVRPGCRHVYYVWAMRFDENIVGIRREQFSEALAAEGFPHFLGYVRPLYLLPVFQKRIAIGSQGYPFKLANTRYEKGMCPVTEQMHEKELVCFETCMYDVDSEHIELLIEAIRKVYAQRAEVSKIQGGNQ